jgi:hypothetical protein
MKIWWKFWHAQKILLLVHLTTHFLFVFDCAQRMYILHKIFKKYEFWQHLAIYKWALSFWPTYVQQWLRKVGIPTVLIRMWLFFLHSLIINLQIIEVLLNVIGLVYRLEMHLLNNQNSEFVTRTCPQVLSWWKHSWSSIF